MKENKLKVAPTQDKHIGTFIVGVKQIRLNLPYFSSFAIVVIEKLIKIRDDILPFFKPELKDHIKLWGEQWSLTLPSIIDPYGMFVFVSSIKVYPVLASSFLKTY